MIKTSFLLAIYLAVASSLHLIRDKKELDLVAHVDGKSYFTESNPPFLNWTQAGDLCREYGLQLATITTIAEFDALKAAARNGKIVYAHWTSGRDAQLPRQFSWNTTNTQVSSNLGFNFVGTDNHKGYQSCLVFMGYTNDRSNLDWRTCHNLHRTLCETK